MTYDHRLQCRQYDHSSNSWTRKDPHCWPQHYSAFEKAESDQHGQKPSPSPRNKHAHLHRYPTHDARCPRLPKAAIQPISWEETQTVHPTWRDFSDSDLVAALVHILQIPENELWSQAITGGLQARKCSTSFITEHFPTTSMIKLMEISSSVHHERSDSNRFGAEVWKSISRPFTVHLFVTKYT